MEKIVNIWVFLFLFSFSFYKDNLIQIHKKKKIRRKRSEGVKTIMI